MVAFQQIKMANKIKIAFVILLLFKIEFILSINNNTNQDTYDKWLISGKPYGCEQGFVAVNYQNNKPVKGACVPIGYDANQIPHPDSAATVYLSIHHQKLLSVDDAENTITFDIKVSDIWSDHRIIIALDNNHSYIKLSPDIKLPEVWLPTAFEFAQVKLFKPTLHPFVYTELRFFFDNRISSDTTILNLTLESRTTLYCNFEFQKFPFDTQICDVSTVTRDPDRLQLWLYDPDHSLYPSKNYESCGFDVSTYFRNSTNGVGFDIKLERLILPYMLQYYLPCMSIVLVSFVSFIVPLSASPGRIGLIVTQFLTLTNIFIHQIVSLMFMYNFYIQNLI